MSAQGKELNYRCLRIARRKKKRLNGKNPNARGGGSTERGPQGGRDAKYERTPKTLVKNDWALRQRQRSPAANATGLMSKEIKIGRNANAGGNADSGAGRVTSVLPGC